MAFSDRDNPLFFRRDGGMDLGQFILLVIVAWVCVVFTLYGLGVLEIAIAAWAFLGSFCGLCFIAWAARERAELIAKSSTPGDIARSIATAVPDTAADRETLIERDGDE